MTTDAPTIHANCVVCGERGVLILGASGAGKSGFSTALIARAKADGLFSRLVADDRVVLSSSHGRLIARPHPRLAGLIERRGLGISEEPHLGEVVLGLVVELSENAERMPAPDALRREIDGVTLPALVLDPRDPAAPGHALRRLATGLASADCDRFALAFAPQHEKIAR